MSRFTSTPGASYSKTIITETKIGPDGSKTTITREVITGGDKGADQSTKEADKAFKGLSLRDAPKVERPKPQKMEDFKAQVVAAHNAYRKQHHVGDVKENKEMSVLAQKWADHLASIGALQHSNDKFQGKELGENVASRWSSQGADYTGQEVTDQWYSEIQKFDFVNGDYQKGTGHFTQVVWKDSKEIGIGKAFGKDGRVFVVGNYHPAGNVLGQFKANVNGK